MEGKKIYNKRNTYKGYTEERYMKYVQKGIRKIIRRNIQRVKMKRFIEKRNIRDA